MKKSYVLVTSLLLLNIVIAIVLNVIANKISDLVSLSKSSLFIITIISLFIALIIGLLLEYRGKIASDESIHLTDIFLSRVITAFPTSIVLGILTAYFCKVVMPIESSFYFTWANIFESPRGPWNYEIIAYLIGLGILYVIVRLRNNYVITITHSLGFGISIPIAFHFFYPGNETVPVITTIEWIILMVGSGIILHTQTIERLKRTVGSVFRFLTLSR